MSRSSGTPGFRGHWPTALPIFSGLAFLCLLGWGLQGAALAGGLLDQRFPAAQRFFGQSVVDDTGRVWRFSGTDEDVVECGLDGKWETRKDVGLPGAVETVAREVDGRSWLLFCRIRQPAARVAASSGTPAPVPSAKSALVRFDGETFSPVAGLNPGNSLSSPGLHVGADGCVWAWSDRGEMVGLRGEEPLTRSLHAPAPKAFEPGNLPFFPPTVALEVPGHGTWFWAQTLHFGAVPMGHVLPSFSGFQVWRNGTWQTLAATDGEGQPIYLGAAALLADGKILCGRRPQGTFFTLDPATGEMTPCKLELPPGESAVFLHLVPGTRSLLVITRPDMTGDAPAEFKDGVAGHLLRVTDGQVETLARGVDTIANCASPLGRSRHAVADTETGTFLAVPGRGLWYVPHTGTDVQHFDLRHGLPVLTFPRLEARGERLYAETFGGGLALFDWRRWLAEPPAPELTRWQIHHTRQSAVFRPDGTVWCLDPDPAVGIRRWDGAAWSSVPLPDVPWRQKVSASYGPPLRFDSRDRLWWFGETVVAVLDKEEWRVFPDFEAALATLADTERGGTGFRVGRITGYCGAVVSGHGGAAYVTGFMRAIRFYEDGRWQSIDRRSSMDFFPRWPFYADGVLTLKVFLRPGSPDGRNEGYIQRQNGQWRPVPDDAVRWPWPDENPAASSGKPPALPPACPLREDATTFRIQDNLGFTWVGNGDELFHGIGDVWVRYPTAGLAAALFRTLGAAWIDAAGACWLTPFGIGTDLLLCRSPDKPSALRLAWADPPAAEVTRGDVVLTAVAPAGATPALCTFQVNGGPAEIVLARENQYDIPFRNLANGDYRCELRAFDAQLQPSPPLTHRFRVRRSLENEGETLVRQLLTADSATREKLVPSLIALGPQILPVVRRYQEQADADMQWWWRALAAEIQHGPALRSQPPAMRGDTP